MKLKPAAKERARTLPDAGPEGIQDDRDNGDGSQDVEKFFDHGDDATPPAKEKSSTSQAEIMQLKSEISEKNSKIAALQNLLEKSKQDIIIRNDAVNSLRRFLGKIRLNLERKTDHVTLFEMVSEEEWIYEKKFGYRKVGNLGAELSG